MDRELLCPPHSDHAQWEAYEQGLLSRCPKEDALQCLGVLTRNCSVSAGTPLLYSFKRARFQNLEMFTISISIAFHIHSRPAQMS